MTHEELQKALEDQTILVWRGTYMGKPCSCLLRIEEVGYPWNYGRDLDGAECRLLAGELYYPTPEELLTAPTTGHPPIWL